MGSNCDSVLVWFRRDLRDDDHAALAAACRQGGPVHCAFVFDREILDPLPREDRRVAFIHASLCELDAALRQRGGGLIVLHGQARQCLPELAVRLGVQTVFANRDVEPLARERDAEVASRLAASGIALHWCEDQVIFSGKQLLTTAGRPYTVFTPYSRAWMRRLFENPPPLHDTAGELAPLVRASIPSLAEIGFAEVDPGVAPGMSGAQRLWESFRPQLPDYAAQRDFPASEGTSRLSVHLRFGTISIRRLVSEVMHLPGRGAETWLKELIWRDFYAQLLDHFPHVVAGAFRREYDALQWEVWPEGLAAWQEGRTGYPLVDAAMRQLRQTGYMHNRLRMLTASFLCKDLGIDWRLGERHFAEWLLDFDLASNNGGWQWAASTGCDAQPWFRIFNPVTQSEKFDPEGEFIRRFVPELRTVPTQFIHAPWRMSPLERAGFGIGRDYPLPIVDHAVARERTLARYGAIRSGTAGQG